MTQQNRALLVVDVQVDFTTGSLAVPGGTEVAQRISDELTGDDAYRYDLVLATQDWHNPLPDLNGGHFAGPDSEPDYVDTWPVHCVADTPGAQFDPALVLPTGTGVMRKGQGVPAYSAFQATGRLSQITMAEVLTHKQIDRLDVVGIATDFCVKASVLDALRTSTVRLSEVRVLTSFCAGVDDQLTAQALGQMEAHGAKIVRQ